MLSAGVTAMGDGGTRVEKDTLGEIEVPAERLWGAQTERSRRHFRISGERMPLDLVHALVLVKKAAALVNAELGELDAQKADAIARACDEALSGRWDEEFPLVVWQTGSGTQTNMNVNEVLANRASEILGGPRGEGRLVHPNDHVNRGQSTNDAFPTAIHVAATLALTRRVVPAVARLRETLSAKAGAYRSLVKIGRTHLMDATPLTLGQEVSGWATQLANGVARLEAALPHLRELALGGTAVGTGLNAHPELGRRAAARLAALTGEPFVTAPSKFEALAARDAAVFAHGALKTVAASLHKIANDVRWLASGPRAGLGEIRIPENEPGSSIMPGKVNPTQAEALTMAAAQVLGNDVTVGIAGMSGHLQLNAFMPVIAHAFLQSARLVADGGDSFREHCAAGLEPVRERIAAHLERSLMLVTALAPRIGYDAAARIAKTAHAEGTTLREASVSLGLLTADQYDEWVRPAEMIGGEKRR
jgi:fumarate hydratase class II